jgi:hypothetical protein
MERPKDERPAHLHAIGELLPPDKEEDDHAQGHLFCLSLSFLPFTTNVTRALPLEAIKEEAGATSSAIEKTSDLAFKRSNDLAIKRQQLEPTSIEAISPPPPPQET